MLDVLVVRHGQSDWNALGRWQGHADPPLSDLGVTQAQEAARTVGMFDAVVASDLDRALTTARIIAETMGLGPVITDAGLRERDIGEWQGLTRAEIETAFPGQMRNGDRPPGWEPDESVLERALASMRRITDHVESGNVLVVSHGGIIYTLEGHLGAEFVPIKNLNGRWFRMKTTDIELGDRVALVTDTADAAADP
jgi:broad specificity phosphatase PhoE